MYTPESGKLLMHCHHIFRKTDMYMEQDGYGTYFKQNNIATFPGTKRICGNPSLFAGISMIFSVIPGNPLEMEFWYQEKVFVAERVSGNER